MSSVSAISTDEFEEHLYACLPDLNGIKRIVVGCSGGPDSMALTYLLSEWSRRKKNLSIHALIVDHGLRTNSQQEAQTVLSWLKDWPNIKSSILTNETPIKTRVQETARNRRYELFQNYCTEHQIHHIVLAHHQDDQAETVLFRLAKGSGLDGLSGISPVQKLSDDLLIIRPLLGVPKQRLVQTCKDRNLPYIEDPSNKNEQFARVRLRQSYRILHAEGLSVERLSKTAQRLARAQDALNKITQDTYEEALVSYTPDQKVELCFDVIHHAPQEIGLRVLLKSIRFLRPHEDYDPRLQKVEALFDDIIDKTTPFRKRTLGGLTFVRNDHKQHIILTKSKPKNTCKA